MRSSFDGRVPSVCAEPNLTQTTVTMLPNNQEERCRPTTPPPSYSTLPPPEPSSSHPPPLPPPPPSPLQQQQHGMMPMAAYPTRRSPTFRRLSARHTEFRVGFAGLFLSALLFIVAFSVPAWTTRLGLWVWCPGYSHCVILLRGGPAWLNATRAMETLALICFLLCLAVALYEEVFKSPSPKETKAVEILAALAAILGLIGLAVYGVNSSGRHRRRGNICYTPIHIDLSWGYWLAAAAIILVLVSAVLVAHSRVRHAALTHRAMTRAGVVPPCPPALSPAHDIYIYPAPIPCAVLPCSSLGLSSPSGSLSTFLPPPYPYPSPAGTTPTAPPAYDTPTAAAPAAGQSAPGGAGAKDQGPSTSMPHSDAEDGSAPTPHVSVYFVKAQS